MISISHWGFIQLPDRMHSDNWYALMRYWPTSRATTEFQSDPSYDSKYLHG